MTKIASERLGFEEAVALYDKDLFALGEMALHPINML